MEDEIKKEFLIMVKPRKNDKDYSWFELDIFRSETYDEALSNLIYWKNRYDPDHQCYIKIVENQYCKKCRENK